MYEIQNEFAEAGLIDGMADSESVVSLPLQSANIDSASAATTGRDRHKIFLPRRSGEGRFAPHQYYYPASRTGVVPKLSSDAA